MLEPKEIDNYFRATSQPKSSPKIEQHTRLVTLAKLVLPGLAAVLAVTLLIFPSLKENIQEFALEFSISDGDIEKMNIEKTTIYVTNDKNKVNNFTSSQIKETSAGSKLYELISPEAIIPLDNNEWINIRSVSGLYNQQTSLLQLQNNVEAFYSRGMSIQTSEAFFDFKTSFGHSDKAVTGDGFLGKIDAEGFEFSATQNSITFLGKTTIIINEESLQDE